VVIGEHISQRLKPKVRVLLDDAGKLVRSRKVVDLAGEPDVRIRRTLEQGKIGFNPRQLFSYLAAAPGAPQSFLRRRVFLRR
jgi:hypothetical protein